MRGLLLLPLVAALPKPVTLPELSLSQWHSIQGQFTDGVRSLSEWSFSKAQEIVHDAQDTLATAGDGDETQQTVWAQLKADPHSFSRLTGVIEFVGGKPLKYLDDPDAPPFTLFAPNNDALKPPEHHKHDHHGHHDDDDDKEIGEIMSNPSLATISSLIERQPAYLMIKDGDSDDDDKKKRRREIFKKIAIKVLEYHGLAKPYTASELAQNSTVETVLKAEDGSYGGLHRRLKVEKTLLPPAVKLNFYATLLVTDKKASNGIFHTINHPLIPPGSIFDSAYLFQDFFSTLTSATQYCGGRHYLDWHYDRNASSPGHPKFHGSPLATLFAPTNAAFALLPPRLKFYLFSPFGRRVLTKVLAYHYIPHQLVLSEFQYHGKHEKESTFESFSDLVEAYTGEVVFNADNDPSFHRSFEVESGLGKNYTLHIEVDKTRVIPVEGAVKVSMKVNGQKVETIDVPARNGAFHVINKLLVPPHHHHDHDHHGHDDFIAERTWDNWEQWLPAWAAAQE